MNTTGKPTATGTFAHLAAAACALTTACALAEPAAAAAPVSAPASIQHESTPSTQTRAARGTLLWAKPVRALTVDQARTSLRETGFDASRVRTGVDLIAIVYGTVDTRGRPTTASGLVARPRGTAGALHTVIHEHGTLAYRGDAPSSGDNPFVMGPSIQAAAAGYLAVAPDYLGLGYGPGTHPYLHIPTEVSASVDMLTAGRALMARGDVAVSGDLFVTGFSQGGPAALAVARELQRHPRGWRVRAVAPVSGPYAIWDEQLPGMFRGEVPEIVSAYYVSYALTAYDKIFDLYGSTSQVFKAPYAARVNTLFGSKVQEEDIIPALPMRLSDLLTATGKRLLTDPHGPLATALRAADATCSWKPEMPVRLYYAADDEQVPAANTAACVRTLKARGINPAPVALPDHPGFDSAHLGSGVLASGRALAWFESIRPPA